MKSFVWLVVALSMVVAVPALAAPKAKEKKAPQCPAKVYLDRTLKDIELTAEQQEKLAAIGKEHGPKLMDLQKKQQAVYTAEQKKARAEAMAAAKAAGKTGQEIYKAADEGLTLSDEQKAQLAELRKESQAAQKELKEAAMAVLNDAQKLQLKQANKKK